MSLLIDGYNLMHAAGVFPRGLGPATLARSRTALLEFLAATIPSEEIPRTTVVFDAFDPPPGLPRQINFRGLNVRFANPEGEADILIERLIAADTAPRRLTVVSSDHRIQRAAKRRRAEAVDSDIWVRNLRDARRRQREAPAPRQRSKPAPPRAQSEVDYWCQEFGIEAESVAVPELHRLPPQKPRPTPAEAQPLESQPPETQAPETQPAEGLGETTGDSPQTPGSGDLRLLPPGPEDVRFWLAQFGFTDQTEVQYALRPPTAPSTSDPSTNTTAEHSQEAKTTSTPPPAQKPSKSRRSRKRAKPPQLDEDIFPPGFGDDLGL